MTDTDSSTDKLIAEILGDAAVYEHYHPAFTLDPVRDRLRALFESSGDALGPFRKLFPAGLSDCDMAQALAESERRVAVIEKYRGVYYDIAASLEAKRADLIAELENELGCSTGLVQSKCQQWGIHGYGIAPNTCGRV